MILSLDRQYALAVTQYEKALDLDPNHPGVWLDFAMTLLQTDSTDYAARALERWAELVGADAHIFGRISILVSQHRRTGKRVQLPPEVDAAPALSPIHRSRLYALAGDRERALEGIERIFRERWPAALEVKVDPAFDSLRKDVRFTALVRRIN